MLNIHSRNNSRIYGLVYFDNETHQTQFIPFLTKMEVNKYIGLLDLGKDYVNTISVVKMVEHWNAYDGLVFPKTSEDENDD